MLETGGVLGAMVRYTFPIDAKFELGTAFWNGHLRKSGSDCRRAVAGFLIFSNINGHKPLFPKTIGLLWGLSLCTDVGRALGRLSV